MTVVMSRFQKYIVCGVFCILIRHLKKNETVSGIFVSLDIKKKQKDSFKDWSFRNTTRPRKLIFDHFCGFGGMKHT